MKIIKYKFLSAEINHGTEEKPDIEQIFIDKFMIWNEINEETAKCEAYNNEYEIYDDGQPDPANIPTKEDRFEAQLTYTAMMTGTLLEEV